MIVEMQGIMVDLHILRNSLGVCKRGTAFDCSKWLPAPLIKH